MASPPDNQPLSDGQPVNRAGHLPGLVRPVYALFSGQTARRGYLSMVDQGIISLTNFAAAVYLARSVSPTEFGVYTVGFLLIHFLRAVQEGVVVQPLSALGAALVPESYRQYLSESFVMQLLLAAASAAAAASLGWYLAYLGNDTAGPTLFALWPVFLLWPLQEFLRRDFYTRGQVHLALVNNAVANGVRLAYLFWLGGRAGLDGAAGLDAIAWGSLAALPPGFWAARRHFTLRLNLSGLWATWKQNWAFGRWVMGALVANWAALEVYPLITAGMVSFAASGAYRALQNLVAPVHVMLRGMDTFLTPHTARRYHHGGARGMYRTLRLAYLVVGGPILALLLAAGLYARPLLELLYEETYLGFGEGVWWFVLFYLLWFSYWPLQTAFKAAKLTRPIFLANLAAIASMFTVGLLLVGRWGVYGTIAGQALNALIISLVLWAAWLRFAKKNGEAFEREGATGET